MDTWEEIKEDQIRYEEKSRIKSELLEWVEDCKKEILGNEPSDNMSRVKFMMLNKLVDKLNSI